MIRIIYDMIAFLAVRKKWALIPLFIIMVTMATLMVLAQTTAVGPFIYAIF